MIEPQDLPFAYDALEPTLDAREVELHYEGHYKGYVDKLNELIVGTNYEFMTLKEIILASESDGGGPCYRNPIYNQAAQVWNHEQYFASLGQDSPHDTAMEVAQRIDAEYGSCEAFKASVCDRAMSHFGDGWVWVYVSHYDSIVVTTTNDGDTIAGNGTVLFCIDLWEHAFLYDPQYAVGKAKYVEAMFDVIDWNTVEAKYLAREISTVAPVRIDGKEMNMTATAMDVGKFIAERKQANRPRHKRK